MPLNPEIHSSHEIKLAQSDFDCLESFLIIGKPYKTQMNV